MKKFAFAALWFYAGWSFGALLATVLGLHVIVGPITGAAVSILFVVYHREIGTAR
jgi:hypothetical protein